MTSLELKGVSRTFDVSPPWLNRVLERKPRVLLRHLPGAASLKAASLIANEAPADASVLGVVSSGALIARLFGNPAADYRLRDFAFVGARTADEYVCAADGESGVETLDDLAKPGLSVGSSAPGRRPYAHAHLLKDLAQTDLRIVSGYRDANEMLLALRRGEVSLLCGLSFETYRAGLSGWLSSGRLKPLMRLSPAWAERLSAVPRAEEIARSKGRGDLAPALEFMALEGALAWTLTAPARVSPERIAELRKAFEAMQADRAYLREAARRNLEVSPFPIARLDEAASRLASTPPAVLDIVKKLNDRP